MFIVEPYNDELLSSWLVRLARKNYTKLSTIICYIFKNNILSYHTTELHIRDLDLYQFKTKQKNILFKKTGVMLDSLQLFKFTGFLDEKIDRYNKKWISEPKATNHNTKHFYATRYCPKCLKEHTYIRQLWRIMLYNVCLKHNCYLLIECPKCNAKFMYIDNGYTRKIYQCYRCNFDLRKSNIQVAKSKDVKQQSKLLNILNYGYYKLNSRYYYSIGLFILIKKLLHTLMHTYQIKVRYINQLKPIQLSKLISHIMFLLEKFPLRLNRFYKKNHITDIHNMLAWEDRDKQAWNLPSWYLSSIKYNVITKKGLIRIIS